MSDIVAEESKTPPLIEAARLESIGALGEL
jgi:hypothetical protein